MRRTISTAALAALALAKVHGTDDGLGSAPPDTIGTKDFAPKLPTILKTIQRQADRKVLQS